MVERKVEEWWAIYGQDVFPLLVPFRRWKEAAEALAVGDIVLVQYRQKFAKDRWRLGRVLGLTEGRDGLVRSAQVGLRNLRRGAREPTGVCKAGLTLLTLPVQRLAVVLPADQQPQEIIRELKEKLEQEALGQPANPGDHAAQQEPSLPTPQVQVRVQEGEDEMIDLGLVEGWRLRVPQPGTF